MVIFMVISMPQSSALLNLTGSKQEYLSVCVPGFPIVSFTFI